MVKLGQSYDLYQAFIMTLSGIVPKKTQDESTQSVVIPQTTDAEMKTEAIPDPSVMDSRQSAGSPKRPNDNSPNVRKKVLWHFRVALPSFSTL